MPTDVAPLVINEYTAVVNVAADAEVLTEVALSNMMVAALNRIEFVRQKIPSISTEIPQSVDIREEFITAFWNEPDSLLHADYTWRTNDGGAPTVSRSDVSVGDFGGVNITLSNNNDQFALHLGAPQPTVPSISADKIERFACLFRPNSALGDLTVMIGMSQDMLDTNPEDVGLWGLAFFIEPGDANWSIRARTAAGSSIVGTGVSFSQSDRILFEIVQTLPGEWSCLINETEVATFDAGASANVITDEDLNFGIHVHLGGSSSVDCDVLYLGMRTASLGQRYD